MRQPYPQLVDCRKSAICGLPAAPDSDSYTPMQTHEPQHAEIGRRLASLRSAFSDDTQAQWAARHGFGKNQYNSWETGSRRISFEAAAKLCRLYGLTLDWIYLGKRDGLSESSSKRL